MEQIYGPNELQGSEGVPLPDIADEPGGFVAIVDGKRVGPSLAVACARSFATLSEHAPWIGPLLHTALNTPLSPESRVKFISRFGDDGRDLYEDREKHEAWRAHVRAVIDESHPWLWPLFEAAGVFILSVPGSFSFACNEALGASFTIPHFSAKTALEPFPDDSKTLH